MPNFSVRLSDTDVQILDKLVVAMRAYYAVQAQSVPQLRSIETTRSSALRDLLSAWDHGMNAPEVFPKS